MAAQRIEERFWARVDKAGPVGCWLWTGTKKSNGYAIFSIRRDPPRCTVRANRYSWMLANGPVDVGMHVLHSCDNRACVNPAHLRLGTHQENIAERDAKGRQVNGDKHPFRIDPSKAKVSKGSDHGNSKLTEEDVLEMIRRCIAGESRPAVSLEYGMSRNFMGGVMRKKRWKHVWELL